MKTYFNSLLAIGIPEVSQRMRLDTDDTDWLYRRRQEAFAMRDACQNARVDTLKSRGRNGRNIDIYQEDGEEGF